MRILKHTHEVHAELAGAPGVTVRSNVTGYTMWLSATNTGDWARRPDNRWPCSELSGHSVCVVVDDNGLCDCAVDNGEVFDTSASELEAIVADHLPADCRHLWPVWE